MIKLKILILLFITMIFLLSSTAIANSISSKQVTKIDILTSSLDCFEPGQGEIIADIEGVPGTASLTALDYDNDGDTDFIAGIRDAGLDPESGIFIFTNNHGAYNSFYYDEQFDLVHDVLTSADYNNDGFDDFVSGGTQGTVRLFLNNNSLSEQPKFDGSEIAIFDQAAWGLTSADFNSDGKIDVAVASADGPFSHSTISIFFNNGDGVFTDQVDVFDFYYSYINSLDSADYDNDGDIDFIIGYSEHNQDFVKIYGIISVLLNDGDNNFDNEVTIARRGIGVPYDLEGGINPQVTSADYDKDGDIDLLVGDQSGKVEFYLNDGSASFTSEGFIHDFGTVSWGVTSADFDRDGDIDFIVAAEHTGVLGHIYLKYNQVVTDNLPANTPIITGPNNGKSGEEYEYIFTSTDPNGDDVYYYVDWGDGTNTEWQGPYNSGEEIKVIHIWNEQDEYIIKAKAKDDKDAESNWATQRVSMPKNKATNRPILKSLQQHPIFYQLLQRFLQL